MLLNNLHYFYNTVVEDTIKFIPEKQQLSKERPSHNLQKNKTMIKSLKNLTIMMKIPV
jgi:hypothetical protein